VLRTSFAALAAVMLALPATAVAGMTRTESSLLREMNTVRASKGLHTLAYDAHLERAAQTHTRAMVRSNVFTHGAFATRLAKFAVTCSVAGENLAWATGTEASPRSIVAAWLASPEHRANLLAPSFRRVGVGELTASFQGYAGAHVVTADFAG
jgi:uncharacterized protein YkwD